MTPHRAHRARGYSGDMQLGRGFTAARRRASRLAGLVRLPAVWPIQTAIRRQASWLAAKASMKSKSRWPFALKKYTTHAESSHPARAAYAPTNYESEFPPAYQRRKIFQPHLSIPTCKGCVCPTPTAGEQSGDRQRREKGPPILTAEKGELRARTIAGVAGQLRCARHSEPRRQNGQ